PKWSSKRTSPYGYSVAGRRPLFHPYTRFGIESIDDGGFVKPVKIAFRYSLDGRSLFQQRPLRLKRGNDYLCKRDLGTLQINRCAFARQGQKGLDTIGDVRGDHFGRSRNRCGNLPL